MLAFRSACDRYTTALEISCVALEDESCARGTGYYGGLWGGEDMSAEREGIQEQPGDWIGILSYHRGADVVILILF
jgi:hypothetical protein